ncbi:VWA domain-containing protein [Shewanella khirikhana]|uniref:vWA domain-containing protein n=1 Tax=Shewanella khirikhana TaxID=1965282 RepID=UPI0030D211D4
MIHFIRPQWLLALIPLALLLYFLWRRRAAVSAWQGYIAPHLAGLLMAGDNRIKANKGLWLLAASWFIATLALAGPAFDKEPMPVFSAGGGRVLVMDMSVSMFATDLVPNRVTQAKFRATDLIEALPEGDTGLIAYAGDAFVISPLTRDKSTLLNLLPSLSPDIMPLLGSSPAEGVALARDLLVHGGHPGGDIILMTDGLDEVDAADIRRALKDSKLRLSVYGFGTAQGAPMKLPDGKLVRGNDDELVMPRLDAAVLAKLASDERGIWLPAGLDGSDVKHLVSWLDREGDAKETELSGDSWQDLGPYIALLLLLPALISFRRGILGALLLCALLPAMPPSAEASIWQTRDQSAMDAFKEGKFADAASGFTREDWKAAADYRAGNFEAALDSFNKDQSANGLYNQGNALMQLGKYDDAANRYAEALKKNPDLSAATQNLALAKALAKALAEQQQQQNGNGENQDNKDQNQEESQSQNQEQNQEQSQQQNQSGEQNQGDQSQQNGADQQNGNNQQGSSQADNQSGDNQAANQQDNSQKASGDAKQQPDASADSAPKPSDPSTESANSGADNANNDQAKQDAPMNADAAQAAQQKDAQQPQQAAGQGLEANQADDNQQAAQSASLGDKQDDSQGEQAEVAVVDPSIKESDLPPEMMRALKAVNDDPAVLLRNKMQLEYQIRRARGDHRKEKEKW